MELETFDKLLASVAKKLGCATGDLTAWLNQTPNTPEAIQQNALRIMTKHGLDPFADEISINHYEDTHWQVFITIEGCSKLINTHSQFNGLVFNQADTLIDGVPEWIECSIFRRDRIMPITVREYFIEVRRDQDIWRKMPRRMLRHRALQQCIRLAIA